MKTLVLIISDDSQSVYANHRDVWRTYMHSDTRFECYFITHRSDILEPCVIGDTFYAVGEEGFTSILKKTADAMEYFLARNRYDFVLRTNLSSVWIFRNMGFLQDLPLSNILHGCLGNVFDIPYVSGAGALMTPDVCNHIIREWRTAEKQDYDDICIGWIATKFGVQFLKGTRHNYAENRVLPNNAYHIRAKAVEWSERYLEPEWMNKCISFYRIPLFIICYNNLTYVRAMVDQLRPFHINVHIIDNKSTYPPLIEYLQTTTAKVIWMDKNYGHTVYLHPFIQGIVEGDKYMVTDPDLCLNAKLPVNFVSILSELADKYDCSRIGFALERPIEASFKRGDGSIYEWETQFWREEIPNSEFEMYHADIDTTFHMNNRSCQRSYAIRVAGNFTCIHKPWIVGWETEWDLNELSYYSTNNVSSTYL